MAMAKWVFLPPSMSHDQLIEQVVLWSHTARKEGLLALENLIPNLPDPFLQKDSNCWSMASSRSACREVLEVEIGTWEGR